MKRMICLLMALSLSLATTALAAGYNYVDPAQFKQWLESGKGMSIVDIQVPAEFQQQHFKGALETNAYPVKTAEEKHKLDKVVPQLATHQQDVVVVCPRGGGGAKNTYDYLKEKGIPENRIFILKDGIQGWPHKDLTIGAKK